MFSALLESYVDFFVIVLPAGLIALTAASAVRAELSRGEAARAVALLAVFLGLWGALAIALARRDILMPPPTLADPPYILILMLGGAGALWALGRLTRLGRRITDAADPALLIGLQIPRVMGAIFLLAWALGAMPWQFAIPAGIGDVWAGVAGYQAMRAVQNGSPDADRAIWRANLIGIGDFIVAVTTGLITSEGFLFLLSHDAPNIINRYPLALFPGFFVGLFLAAHLISLSKLANRRQRAARA